MSHNRFDEILQELTFTNKEAPSFKDRFWEICYMVDAWNKNMVENFILGWITCLDESMSPWTNKWTCPGYICLPRKPHPFGNKFHTIFCGLCGIMFTIELLEGKYHLREILLPENTLGPTVGLLLILCRSLYTTGKVVIFDSGFCDLQGIIELRKKGVFAGALIKKRRYWPKYVPGDAIDEKFKTMEVEKTAVIMS